MSIAGGSDISVQTVLNRRISLRGEYSIAFYGLLGVVAVVVGVGLLIAHKGTAPITIGLVVLLAGLASLLFTVRRK
jgi:uncharacterized membrane protein